MKRLMIATTLVVVTASSAFAFGEATIEANKAVQDQRIEQGRYTGQLTRREYRDLKKEQARIDALDARAKSDGRVSRREYNRIHDAQIDAYRHIKEGNTNSKVSFYRRWLYRHR